MSTEVYRIVSVMQTSATSSSTGHSRLFTEESDLLRDLLPMQMKLDRYKERPTSAVKRILLDFWMDFLGQGGGSEIYPYPIVIRVERHIIDTLTGKGRWLLVSWGYEPPRVWFNGEDAQ